MRLLSLDIGTRRTGAAFAEKKADIVMALDTIEHATDEELVAVVQKIIGEKSIDQIAVGLPKLLRGEEGSQSKYSRMIAEKLRNQTGLPVMYIDERFTSLGAEKGSKDAKAACEIAQIALQKAN